MQKLEILKQTNHTKLTNQFVNWEHFRRFPYQKGYLKKKNKTKKTKTNDFLKWDKNKNVLLK
ncbi:iron ABC transporter ATP-binding protein, partial [Staphylococcus hyicus]